LEQAEAAMDSDETSIHMYLKSYPGQFVSAAEICRRAASKRRYREQPDWAVPILRRLFEKGLLESDATGHYRLAPARGKQKKTRRWVSPHIQKILNQSGKTFEIVSPEEDSGDVGQHYR
jgi:hypothetical protein